MREDWKYLPLGEVTSSINGLWKGKKPPFVNVGVIRNANFTKEFTLNLSNIVYLDVEERQYSTRKLQRGDLIVEKSGGSEKQPVGRTILFDLEGEYSVSNFTSILRIKDKTSILPTFLYKYLLYIYKEGYTKEMQNATTGIHNIIYDKFLSIPIPILSLAEQERIVSLLDTQFAKIDALKDNAASQLQAAKDLFHAALKQKFISGHDWKYLPFEGCLVRVPKQKAVKSKEYLQEGLCPIVSQESDLISGYSNDESLLYKHEKPIVIFGDHTKNIKYIDFDFIVGADGVHILLVKDNILPKFFYYELCSIKLRDLGYARHYKLLKEKVISFPSLPEQERIAARLDEISEKVKALQANYDQTINLCNDLKQALLKSIFA